MGLNFSHSEAHWSYGGFNDFRRKLAKEVGIDLDAMEGFNGDLSWENVADPIKYLLNHSDCDGEISPEHCALVAPRIRELVADWNSPTEEHHRVNAIRLAEGMEVAAKDNEPLEFG